MGKQDEIKALKNAYKDKLACEPNEAWEIVIEALEKQIPKKLIRIDFLHGKCECKAVVGIHESYCHNCGQKLDWSVENE